MCEAKKERRQVLRGTSLAASSVLLSTILLAGCASVGDALNPVGWYNGIFGSSDNAASAQDNSGFPTIPNDKRPDVSSTKERAELSKGLAADHANAKYTQDVLRREGNPTQPLSAEASIAPKETPTPAAASSSSSASASSSSVLLKQPQAAPAVAAAPVPAPAALPEPAVQAAAAPAVAPSPPASPKQPPSRLAVPQAAPDAAAMPAKPTVAVDDAPPPPPPPPRLSMGGAVPAPAAVVSSAAQTSAPAAQAPVPATAPTPAAAAPTPTPAPAAAQVAAATPAMTAPANMPPAASSVEDVYRRRLAEFAAGTVPVAAPAAAPATARTAAPAVAASEPDPGTVLISPAEYRRRLARDNGGARPLEAFDGSHSAASFQVAAVRFGEGTAELSSGEQQHLKDVVALYREKGGSIRIFGRSASPRLEIDAQANQLANRQLAGGRAAAIARELVKMGVPAPKIFAGVAPAIAQASAQVPATNGETTEIYIDY